LPLDKGQKLINLGDGRLFGAQTITDPMAAALAQNYADITTGRSTVNIASSGMDLKMTDLLLVLAN